MPYPTCSHLLRFLLSPCADLLLQRQWLALKKLSYYIRADLFLPVGQQHICAVDETYYHLLHSYFSYDIPVFTSPEFPLSAIQRYCRRLHALVHYFLHLLQASTSTSRVRKYEPAVLQVSINNEVLPIQDHKI